MKILVLGVYYSNNLGDGVICQCVANRLKVHFPDADITIEDLVDRHEFVAQEGSTMEEVFKRRLRPVIRRVATKYFAWDKQLVHEEYRLAQNILHLKEIFTARWDAVVVAGGQLFMDRYALFLETVIQECENSGIPLFINACGTGPTVSRTVRNRLTEAMKNPCVKYVSSRDDVKQLKTLYKMEKVVASYDPALWTKDVYHVEKDETSQIIGLGIMYAESRPVRAMVNIWKNIIRELDRKNLKWKIFVNGSDTDVTFARYVIEQIPELTYPAEHYMAERPVTPDELVKTIAQFKSIISFRLHSHIIAASLGIPSAALVWDNKLQFFFDKIGYGNRCCTVYDKASDVVLKLEKAQEEGYNTELIMEQKLFAENLLLEAMNKGIS